MDNHTKSIESEQSMVSLKSDDLTPTQQSSESQRGYSLISSTPNASPDPMIELIEEHTDTCDEKEETKSDDFSADFDTKKPYKPSDTIEMHGYTPLKVISPTLQGSICRVSDHQKNQTYCIKLTQKDLHSKGLGRNKQGKLVPVSENIIAETKILRFLTQHNPSPAMVKCIDFFEDDHNYFLVMEDGGTDLLEFVNFIHKQIRETKKVALSNWKDSVKRMTSQIVQFLDWMHTHMQACHLDMSLENMLISNVEWELQSNGTQFLKPTFQIKVCDFGLSEFFKSESGYTSFESTKFVGKLGYQSPQLYNKKSFDARSADIWAFGVCLFMLLSGAHPWKMCDVNKDSLYHYIAHRQRTKAVLQKWNRTEYVSDECIDLLHRIFAIDEYRRIGLNGIMQHPYLQ